MGGGQSLPTSLNEEQCRHILGDAFDKTEFDKLNGKLNGNQDGQGQGQGQIPLDILIPYLQSMSSSEAGAEISKGYPLINASASSDVLKAKKNPEIPFPKDGINMAGVNLFIEECGGRDQFVGLTTTAVCKKFLLPMTLEKKCSYCDILKERKDSNCGRSDAFISHAWKYTFLEVMDAINEHFENEPNAYFFFDLFTNNQHAAPSLDFEWWSSTFMTAIKDFGRTVLVLSPWRSPIPLTRVWCLFEIICTILTDSKFEVCMRKEEKQSFCEAILTDDDEFFQMLSAIDVRNSGAWRQSDKDQIFATVEQTVGFGGTNSRILEKIRGWALSTLRDNVDKEMLDVLHAKYAYANILYRQGMFKESMECVSKCLEEYLVLDQQTPKIGRQIGACYHRQGTLYRCMGDYQTAIARSRLALGHRIALLGEDSLEVASTYQSLAICYKKQERHEEALKNYNQALRIRVQDLGPDSLEVATTYNSLAAIQRDLGQLEVALSTSQKALLIIKGRLGERHPDTARVYVPMAGIYLKMKDLPQAEQLYKQALDIYREKLGTRHPDTAYCLNNLGHCYSLGERYQEEKRCLQESYDIRKEVLGANHVDTRKTWAKLEKVEERLSSA